ncbi:hypothetical protein [Lysobacter brunescens]|uniref:DUF4926 domain-containing protein n=1 Tax=Lysobacter brunescens TaxID=262323 RepID=A0ABW2YC90_9GAMM
MTAIREYDAVRVRSLDGCRGCTGLGARAPAIGDTGAVVSILSADGLPDMYLVECVQPDATTAWLASFPEHALERVAHAETAP